MNLSLFIFGDFAKFSIFSATALGSFFVKFSSGKISLKASLEVKIFNPQAIASRIALSKLGQFANTDGFYFGFDNSVAAFSHLVISWYQFALTFIFGAYLGQILFYFVYYFLTFYFGLRLLKKLFPNSKNLEIRVGAPDKHDDQKNSI